MLRRWAPMLLRRAVRVTGINDTVSGFVAFRLMTLKNWASALRHEGSWF